VLKSALEAFKLMFKIFWLLMRSCKHKECGIFQVKEYWCIECKELKPFALGFSLYLFLFSILQSGLPYAEVLYKNSYIGRTFIKPSLMRNQAVDMKFGALVSNVRDKRIVLIDDSIVRGTTMQPIVGLLRRSGAKEVISLSLYMVSINTA
jgi:uracil phosphoribosyltransferase